MSDNTRGFTIVELIIAISLGGMMAIVLFGITIFMYGGVVRNEVRSELTLESQDILRSTVDDLRVASSVRDTNTISDPNGPVGGWVTSNANTILIISTPALDGNNNFIVDTSTGKPYQNEYVYYADGTNLLKRVLANTNAPNNSATTTCPEALATVSCPPDRKLSSNFTAMNFVFYDQDNAVTTNLSQVRSISIDIDLTRNALGQNINISNSIRVTLRNSL